MRSRTHPVTSVSPHFLKPTSLRIAKDESSLPFPFALQRSFKRFAAALNTIASWPVTLTNALPNSSASAPGAQLLFPKIPTFKNSTRLAYWHVSSHMERTICGMPDLLNKAECNHSLKTNEKLTKSLHRTNSPLRGGPYKPRLDAVK